MRMRSDLMGHAAAALIGAALLSYAPAAQASTYDFDGLTSGAGGSGTVDLVITTGASDGSSPSNGGFFITSVTGTVLTHPVDLAGGTDTPPSFLTSSDGAWYYDNVLYPTLTSPYGTAFDNPGLLLENLDTGNLINIFSEGSGTYTLGQSPNQQQQALVVLGPGLSATTPLPSTWTMLMAGFASLGYFAFRGSKKSSAIAAA